MKASAKLTKRVREKRPKTALRPPSTKLEVERRDAGSAKAAEKSRGTGVPRVRGGSATIRRTVVGIREEEPDHDGVMKSRMRPRCGASHALGAGPAARERDHRNRNRGCETVQRSSRSKRG